MPKVRMLLRWLQRRALTLVEEVQVRLIWRWLVFQTKMFRGVQELRSGGAEAPQ